MKLIFASGVYSIQTDLVAQGVYTWSVGGVGGGSTSNTLVLDPSKINAGTVVTVADGSGQVESVTLDSVSNGTFNLSWGVDGQYAFISDGQKSAPSSLTLASAPNSTDGNNTPPSLQPVDAATFKIFNGDGVEFATITKSQSGEVTVKTTVGETTSTATFSGLDLLVSGNLGTNDGIYLNTWVWPEGENNATPDAMGTPWGGDGISVDITDVGALINATWQASSNPAVWELKDETTTFATLTKAAQDGYAQLSVTHPKAGTASVQNLMLIDTLTIKDGSSTSLTWNISNFMDPNATTLAVSDPLPAMPHVKAAWVEEGFSTSQGKALVISVQFDSEVQLSAGNGGSFPTLEVEIGGQPVLLNLQTNDTGTTYGDVLTFATTLGTAQGSPQGSISLTKFNFDNGGTISSTGGTPTLLSSGDLSLGLHGNLAGSYVYATGMTSNDLDGYLEKVVVNSTTALQDLATALTNTPLVATGGRNLALAQQVLSALNVSGDHLVMADFTNVETETPNVTRSGVSIAIKNDSTGEVTPYALVSITSLPDAVYELAYYVPETQGYGFGANLDGVDLLVLRLMTDDGSTIISDISVRTSILSEIETLRPDNHFEKGTLLADTLDMSGAAASTNYSINGDAGDDVLIGHSGRDEINGGWGDDNISAGAGDDLIYFSPNHDTVSGGDGWDTLALGLANYNWGAMRTYCDGQGYMVIQQLTDHGYEDRYTVDITAASIGSPALVVTNGTGLSSVTQAAGTLDIEKITVEGYDIYLAQYLGGDSFAYTIGGTRWDDDFTVGWNDTTGVMSVGGKDVALAASAVVSVMPGIGYDTLTFDLGATALSPVVLTTTENVGTVETPDNRTFVSGIQLSNGLAITFDESATDAKGNSIMTWQINGGVKFQFDDIDDVLFKGNGVTYSGRALVEAAEIDIEVANANLAEDVSGDFVSGYHDGLGVGGVMQAIDNGTAVNLTMAGNFVGGNDGRSYLLGRLYETDTSDTLTGNDGDNVFIGGAGVNNYNGMLGADAVSYDRSASNVKVSLMETGDQNTGVSHDTLISIEGLFGSDYNDELRGSGRSNELDGSRGSDILYGGRGADKLIGGNGVDELHGGLGNDYLEGGFDRDILEGGLGADTFAFDLSDVLTDYSSDRILDFNTLADSIRLYDRSNTMDLSAAEVHYDSTTGALTIDMDGAANAAIAAVTLAYLQTGLGITDPALVSNTAHEIVI